MKKLFFLILTISILSSCASNREYNTASFKSKEYRPNLQNIALNPNGLSIEQIKAISSTKPPKDFPVDIAIIFIDNGYIASDIKDSLQYGIVTELKKSKQIDRITIIPSFILPRIMSFSAIQELGIRALSEIVIVFNMNSGDIYQTTEFLASKIKVTSKIEYMIVDSSTSAILTTDRLFSEKIYEDKWFKQNEEDKAIKEIISEQAIILGNSINSLFNKADKDNVKINE